MGRYVVHLNLGAFFRLEACKHRKLLAGLRENPYARAGQSVDHITCKKCLDAIAADVRRRLRGTP